MKLTPEVVASFAPAKVFRDNSGEAVNGLDIHSSGRLAVTSGDDETLHVYNTQSGEYVKEVQCRKYGCALARFTHKTEETVIHASKNGWYDTIRYLSLFDNKYLAYFSAHRDRVTALAVSPLDDTFLSSSLDGTTRLWDTRTPRCQGLLRRDTGATGVAYDPSGRVFGAVADSEVKLYDRNNHSGGPFASFTIDHEVLKQPDVRVTGLEFAPDGNTLLVATNTNAVFLLDAFDGVLQQTFTSFENGAKRDVSPSFSPDGEFVLAGSEDQTIHVWQASTGQEVAVWEGGHDEAVRHVRWNPQMMMAASVCTNVTFWIPTIATL
jgi:COMPASS component SWD2